MHHHLRLARLLTGRAPLTRRQYSVVMSVAVCRPQRVRRSRAARHRRPARPSGRCSLSLPPLTGRCSAHAEPRARSITSARMTVRTKRLGSAHAAHQALARPKALHYSRTGRDFGRGISREIDRRVEDRSPPSGDTSGHVLARFALSLVAGASAFVQPALRTTSKLAASRVAPAQMVLEPSSVMQSSTNCLPVWWLSVRHAIRRPRRRRRGLTTIAAAAAVRNSALEPASQASPPWPPPPSRNSALE